MHVHFLNNKMYYVPKGFKRAISYMYSRVWWRSWYDCRKIGMGSYVVCTHHIAIHRRYFAEMLCTSNCGKTLGIRGYMQLYYAMWTYTYNSVIPDYR